MATGIVNVQNTGPELPLQAQEDFLSTPMFNLINSYGVEKFYAEAHQGKNTRMSRWDPLSTDGGYLDGSGVDPAPEVPIRSDIDAEMEIYAKSIVINEQVDLFNNARTQTKFVSLLGQWMREKEDLLMRDLYASSPTYINATGGTNGDVPTNPARSDFNNVESVLLGNDAQTMMESLEASEFFGTAPVRDAFVCLAHTDLTKDLQGVSGVLLKANYPTQSGLKKEEYCSISRFRVFTSSKGGIKELAASFLGNPVYKMPMYGVEAAAKIEQNGYSAGIGYRDKHIASRVAQNGELYAKFAIARALTNQQWLSGIRCTRKGG
jgi:N4-gp56 family major capsid protein